MTDTTTMTAKGQVTVPREIRDRLGLKPGDKVAFTLLSNGTVVMRLLEPLLESTCRAKRE